MASLSVVSGVLILVLILQATLCLSEDQNQRNQGNNQSDKKSGEKSDEDSSKGSGEDKDDCSECSDEMNGSGEDEEDESNSDEDSSEESGSNEEKNAAKPEDSCEIYCYCTKDAQPQCAATKPKPRGEGDDSHTGAAVAAGAVGAAAGAAGAAAAAHHHQKKPSQQRSHTGAAVAAGAVAGAAGMAAAAHNQQKKPSQQRSPPPANNQPQSKPQQPKPKQTDDSKCNWCIRQKCNPGACKEATNFDAKTDAKNLREAVAGMGTDEKKLINILTHRSEEQLEKIRQAYQEFGKGMDKDIADDTSMKTKKLLLALATPRATFFADELHKAFKDEDVSAMVMILTSLSPCAIKEIGSAYSSKYKKPLADAIRDATALNFETFLVELSKGKRDTSDKVDPAAAEKDAEALIQAGPKKWIFKDEKKFIEIFSTRSYAQLREIIKAYNKKRPGTGLVKDIKSATDGKLQKGLLTLVKNVQDQPGYFANELEGSLDKLLGFGIEDNDKLVRIMRGRCGIDLGDIRDAYPRGHDGKQLSSRLKKKTIFDYEAALLAMLDQQ